MKLDFGGNRIDVGTLVFSGLQSRVQAKMKHSASLPLPFQLFTRRDVAKHNAVEMIVVVYSLENKLSFATST